MLKNKIIEFKLIIIEWSIIVDRKSREGEPPTKKETKVYSQ